jgi:ABC-2 type transport system ATP-binding protein
MDQAERLCERVCLIARSRKVLDADLRELKAAERKGVVAVEFRGSDRWLQGPEVSRIESVNGGFRLFLNDGADHQAILRRGVEARAEILRFDLLEPRLHEIFVRHAGEEGEADDGAQAAATGVRS